MYGSNHHDFRSCSAASSQSSSFFHRLERAPSATSCFGCPAYAQLSSPIVTKAAGEMCEIFQEAKVNLGRRLDPTRLWCTGFSPDTTQCPVLRRPLSRAASARQPSEARELCRRVRLRPRLSCDMACWASSSLTPLFLAPFLHIRLARDHEPCA